MRLKAKKTQTLAPAVSYQACPAKTWASTAGTLPGRSVENHCRIVGEVARALIRRLPHAALFPPGAEFVAACHDIGKVSPTFYSKLMKACGHECLPGINPEWEREWGGHAGVSQATAVALGAPDYVPQILGQHHGFSPQLGGKNAQAEVFGGPSWQAERAKLVSALQEALGATWCQVTSEAEARLLAGLTSVADWIGSGQHFEDPSAPWEDNIERALDEAGFVPATYRRGLSFQDVFGFPPREAQSLLIEEVTAPGVYVLEAPMGLGKTEASLYCAYRMLASGQASGIYFALPTQLTSNRIYERFNAFLTKILAEDCAHRSLLLHSNAWLLDTEMGEEGRPGGAWFSQAKRGLLAPFAVGTIDQALMAAMNVKHGFVRAFGLAGKVVILDEVHSYDAYTGTLLDALVKLLRELRCTVIILSATLNRERRQELTGSARAMEYPLVSAARTSDMSGVREIAVPAPASRTINVSLIREDATAVDEALDRAARGQQVLWIENTVKDAQQRYLDLAARGAELGVVCGLLHSRFTQQDRYGIEQEWVGLFGKEGWGKRLEQGRILVGTQVLEQSLDIDADFMVSRFAPTDMLLQRLGRLWRHENAPRISGAVPEAWLLAPDGEAAMEDPEAHFMGTAFVYSPYVLCRSLEVWRGVTKLSLPHDIRGLIEETYASREEQGVMRRWLYELDHGNQHSRGRMALRQLARLSLATSGVTLPESKAQTRYVETDNFEVLLLRTLDRNREGTTARLTLLDGTRLELPLRKNRLSKRAWRELSVILSKQVVTVHAADAPKALPLSILKGFGLQHCFHIGNGDFSGDESTLRVALVDDTRMLRGVEHFDVHDKYRMEYRQDLGFRVIKRRDA